METRRNMTNSRISGRTGYQYGSAVRKLEAAPEIRPHNPAREERRRQEREQYERERRKEIRRSNSINLAYTVMLAVCATVVFFICYQYLNLQADIKVNSKQVTQLQDELNSLKIENDSYETEINTSIDYDAIYDTAVNELGMVYPSKSQVINYDATESEYVKQFKDVD